MIKKAALITGATGEIGGAVAVHLSEKGYDLLITGRDQAKLKKIAGACSSSVTIIVDVTKKEGLKDIIDEANKIKQLDVVFFNHGVHKRNPIAEMSEEDILLMLNLHLISTILLTKRLLPLMLKKASNKEAQKAIIFMGSVSSKLSMKNNAVYGAAKHGLRGFSGALFEEIREEGIKVSTLCPGYINSRDHNHAVLDEDKMIQVSDIVKAVDFIVGAVMRKLLHIIYGILKHGRDFDPSLV